MFQPQSVTRGDSRCSRPSLSMCRPPPGPAAEPRRSAGVGDEKPPQALFTFPHLLLVLAPAPARRRLDCRFSEALALLFSGHTAAGVTISRVCVCVFVHVCVDCVLHTIISAFSLMCLCGKCVRSVQVNN